MSRATSLRVTQRLEASWLARIAVLASLSFLAAACSDSDDPIAPEPEPEPQGNLVEVAQEAGTFSTLLAAAEAAGLVGTLSDGGPFTLFAPNDAAFGALPESAIDRILGDTELLTRVLTYHLVPGELNASAVLGSPSLQTVNGATLSVRTEGSSAFVNDARIVTTDVEASNGIIHVIDGVLLPEPVLDIPGTAAAAGIFSTLLTAVQAAGLVETLQSDGPFTVFAPTDDAFAALPAGALDALLADPALLTRVLTYHVVAGAVRAEDVVGLTSAETVNGASVAISLENGGVKIDGANVIATDIEATNGVIHVIDAVLLPEPVLDIPGTAAAAGIFSTLLAAVEAAELVETLQSAGPFTVFAPTDDAFAALPEGALEGLLADPDALRAVLLYHVVAGEVTAAEVVGLTSAETVNGASVTITVENGGVKIDDANVIATDVRATNGIIHILDAVILPPTE